MHTLKILPEGQASNLIYAIKRLLGHSLWGQRLVGTIIAFYFRLAAPGRHYIFLHTHMFYIQVLSICMFTATLLTIAKNGGSLGSIRWKLLFNPPFDFL